LYYASSSGGAYIQASMWRPRSRHFLTFYLFLEKRKKVSECAQVVLRPQDLVVVLKFAANRGRILSTQSLSLELELGLAEVSTALQRAVGAQLLAPSGLSPTRGRPIKKLIINRASLTEFVTHGVRYAFAPDRGKLTRGMPTAQAAPPFRTLLPPDATPPVWPDSKGEVRGESFSPLHACVVPAARRDPNLYDLLAIVDGLRGSSARIRELAARLFEEKVNGRF
jgi:hypothetical protein